MAHPLTCWDIIREGRYRSGLFEKDLAALHGIMRKNKWRFSYPQRLRNGLVWENKTIIVTDPSLLIILATCNMYEMNGYRPDEVIGLSPKIFQGPATDPDEKMRIRKAIRSQSPFQSAIVNYRKDGSRYHCRIEACPVFNSTGELVNFIALENIIYERKSG